MTITPHWWLVRSIRGREMTVSTMILRSGSSWLPPRPFGFGSPEPKVGPTPMNVFTSSSSLCLGHLLSRRLKSYFQKLGRLDQGPRSRDSLQSASWARFCLFGEGEDVKDLEGNQGNYDSKTSCLSPFNERRWTNVLLALNVVIYIAQVATQGKLMFWGAKINELVDEGQLWRLVTSVFLHANVGHLLVNCYSLNAVGPSVEKISGPGRYLTVYFASAIASSTMSYFFSNDAAVGASGAIFGLVGSIAVYLMRHKGQAGGGKRELQHIVNVIALNMVIGLLSEGIDNWGHLGGLLGGAAASWLIGPAWDYESLSPDGRIVFADRAPIFYLINSNKRA